jgi:N-acetylglucosaminyldiphosphoundecaprenol N-acetyl-beta-D-mannosaminyltransferase
MQPAAATDLMMQEPSCTSTAEASPVGESPTTIEVPSPPESRTIRALGLPLAPLTAVQVLERVDELIRARTPAYFITANLNYAMLSSRHDDLREVNRHAAFILADGMPLVWMARWRGTPLPQRVAGSDLIFDLSELAAHRGYRVFLFGAAPGIARQAAANLEARFPSLQVVGVESPDLGALSEADHEALLDRIRATRPDILFVALGQPKGERWIFARYRELGVPVSVQVGASLDFVAGRVNRAPRILQRTGLEWVYRLALEPRRLTRRYLENGLFFLGRLLRKDKD